MSEELPKSSEKLIDLVVLLTTKLDNNIEGLRREFNESVNTNVERY